MKKSELEFVLNQNNYLKGGTKKSCILVRDFLKNATISRGEISSISAVTAEEFVKAVKILLAAASQNNDVVPDTWHCDSDCKLFSFLPCPGEYASDKNAKNLCPYFTDEGSV